MQSVAEFSFFDPAVAEDPFPLYAALRREAPVHRVAGAGFFLVSRYALIAEALRSPAVFSNRFAAAMQAKVGGVRPELAAIAREGYPPVDTLLTNDPPSHTRYRTLVTKAFSARRVRTMEAAIRALARELVENLLRDGAVELVERFAVPLPLTVIADELGVSREDLPRFKTWSDDSVAPLGQMISPERELACARSVVEFQHYFTAIASARRAEPRDDLISDLVHAKVAGERPLEIGELLSVVQQLLVAGNETTTNAIAAAVQLLIEHPAELEKLRAHPERIPNAVEEVLRLETPVQGMWRVAAEDTELGGVAIPKGSFVMLRYAAANRDESVFPDPDRFDVDRPNARDHLAFGMGIHFCVGAALARTEAATAIATLLERTSGLRFAPGRNAFRHHPSILLRGLEQLWVELDPAWGRALRRRPSAARPSASSASVPGSGIARSSKRASTGSWSESGAPSASVKSAAGTSWSSAVISSSVLLRKKILSTRSQSGPPGSAQSCRLGPIAGSAPPRSSSTQTSRRPVAASISGSTSSARV